MKKKIWALCLTFVLALATFALSGCTLFGNVGKIEWVKQPAKIYSLNDTTGLSFEFVATVNGKEVTVKYPEDKEYKDKVVISNFFTTSVGSRNATVTYERLTLSFAYKVVDGKYADGTGSIVDPYVISTTTHFQNMLNETEFHYYKLANSLDFTGKTIKMANKGKDATSAEAWVGELDGANYTVSGISRVITSNEKESNKYNEMFGRVGRENEKFTLKNITFDFASEGNSATMGIVNCNGKNASLEFNNVNVTGYINAAHSANPNVAPYVTFLNRSGVLANSVKFVNCENSINIYNSYSVGVVSGFVGAQYHPGHKGSIVFDGCTFKGRIEGAKEGQIGVFYTSVVDCNDAVIVKSNCKTKDGVIVKTGDLAIAEVATNGKKTVDFGETDGVSVDKSLKAVDSITLTDDLKLSCKVTDNANVTSYKVYVVGEMTYQSGESGAGFRYTLPCDATNGVLNAAQLKKISYNGGEVPANGDATYGSNLIRLNEATGNLVYYGNSVCASIQVENVAKIVVVAYEGKKAVAFGVKTGSWNFAA